MGVVAALAVFCVACQTVGGAVSIDDAGPAVVDASVAADATVLDAPASADTGVGSDTGTSADTGADAGADGSADGGAHADASDGATDAEAGD